MKILTILGSPRKKGNTAKVLGFLDEDLRKWDHEVERLHIDDYELKGCRECYHCRVNPDEPDCIQNDNGNMLFNRMIDADALVYASPLFCWGFSGPMKNLVDRSFCLVNGYNTPNHISLIGGKPAALLVTGAGPIENNFDLIGEVFRRYARWCRLDFRGELFVPGCTVPENIGDEIREKTVELAKKITGGR